LADNLSIYISVLALLDWIACSEPKKEEKKRKKDVGCSELAVEYPKEDSWFHVLRIIGTDISLS